MPLTPELVVDLEHFGEVMFWAGAGFGSGAALVLAALGLYLLGYKRAA
jgi:hypothetical protein